jgi:hypothetical protein
MGRDEIRLDMFTTKQRGDQLEDEIEDRLCYLMPALKRCPVNTMGIDFRTEPDFRLAIQAKNSQDGVSPEAVSHFSDTAADYSIRWMIGNHFTSGATARAKERGVYLLTTHNFRCMFPLVGEPKRTVTHDDKVSRGPISIMPAVFGQVEPRPIILIASRPIEPVSIARAHPPKNPYDNVWKKKEVA